MRYILNERFALRGWELLPYAVADRRTGRARFISAQEMEALKLCSGRIETDLAKCITDSFYMNFINTRADKVLEHNPECADCPWRNWCLGGCRASGLDGSGQTDLLYKDPACCMMFKDGWIRRLTELMKEIRPRASCPVTEDENLMNLLEQQQKAVKNEKGG